MPFHTDDPLVCQFQGDGKHWILTAPLHWTDTKEDWTVIVPVGFDTDLASIPRPFWPLFPPSGRYAPAAVLHDWLYWHGMVQTEPITRRYADHVLRTAAGDLGVSWPVRWAIWDGVRAFGHWRWQHYRALQAAGVRSADRFDHEDSIPD
jgi:hypothetical protein